MAAVDLGRWEPMLPGEDQVDFETLLPLLDSAERTWLREALATTATRHPWLDAL